MRLSGRRGTILIVALWIVAILTVFAVSAGRQSSISLKLTSYYTDSIKSYFIAKAGIMRALAEKGLEYRENLATNLDAFSEKWANNPGLFKARAFGDGTYTVGYDYPAAEDDGEPMKLYGLMDEQSKININKAPAKTIYNLLVLSGIDEDAAEEMAASVADWRDEDADITASERGFASGAEDDYYQLLDKPYHCKNKPLDNIYELVLVKGFDRDAVNTISPYITVYGEGKVNINTASRMVLDALFGPDFPDLGTRIEAYRDGNDEISGTSDDRWFSWGAYTIERGEEGFVEVKNLQDAEWYNNINGISNDEYQRIRALLTGGEAQLSTSSKTYRAVSTGESDRVKSRIQAVFTFNEKGKPPAVEFWYQE